MDISKQIVDQRVGDVLAKNKDFFEEYHKGSNAEVESRRFSAAFLCLAVSHYLNIDLQESFSLLTDGGNDCGIDAIQIGDVIDGEFMVTIFQSKYHRNLDKDKNFPSNEIHKITSTILNLFDPRSVISPNTRLQAIVEQIRSLIIEGNIPIIKAVMVSNGLGWNDEGQNYLDQEGFNTPGSQVDFEHYSHVDLTRSLKSFEKINVDLRTTGKSVLEEFNFKRVLICKVLISEIAQLMEEHGGKLFEKNVRNFLGLTRGNRVNNSIKETILDESKKSNFYFYNNGVTLICEKFVHNALMKEDWIIKTTNLQIINGGQTCKTIHETLKSYSGGDYSDVFVMVRLYELSNLSEDQSLVSDITVATNSQTPVDFRDLAANKKEQMSLEQSVLGLGYQYKRKRDGSSSSSATVIPSSVAAEAVYSIWRKSPHQVKSRSKELFGKYYDKIFRSLNGSQLILAVLIYRYCDNARKKASEGDLKANPHILYSAHHLSLVIGSDLLSKTVKKIEGVDHKTFEYLKGFWESNSSNLYKDAVEKMTKYLDGFLNKDHKKVDLRRLSAVFRSGEFLKEVDENAGPLVVAE